MNDKLLYELEYQVNELRKQYLNRVKYDNLTLREILDLGFNNSYLQIDGYCYNTGYKWFDYTKKLSGYDSDDLELNENQLNCKMKLINDTLGDYNYQEITLILANDNDKKYFIDKEDEDEENKIYK